MRKLIKILAIIFICLFSIQNTYAQAELPASIAELNEYYQMVNKQKSSGIKVKEVWKYQIIHGKVTANNFKELEIKFNPEGLVSEKILLGNDNRIKTITTYTYNEFRLPDAEITQVPSGTVVKRIIYRYDDNHLIDEIAAYSTSRYIDYKIVYIRDSRKNKLFIQTYINPDSISESTIYTYSRIEEDYPVKIEKNMGTDELIYSIKIIRDKESNKILQEIYSDNKGEESFRLNYKYDHLGKNKKVEYLLPDKSTRNKLVYNFDEEGNLTGMAEFNLNSDIIKYYKYTYR